MTYRPVICTECEWTGVESEIDKIKDPKADWNEWSICPLCRQASHIEYACDEPGCGDKVSCGWPTKDGGYRHTCGKHMQESP